MITPSRRGFLTGLTSLIVAPAIVRIENLMPVKAIEPFLYEYEFVDVGIGYSITRKAIKNNLTYIRPATLKVEGAEISYDHLDSYFARGFPLLPWQRTK